MRRVEQFLGLPQAKYPQNLLEHRRCELLFRALSVSAFLLYVPLALNFLVSVTPASAVGTETCVLTAVSCTVLVVCRNANPNQIEISAATKQALLDFYRPHNAWLERLFPGTNVQHWNEWEDE